MHLGGPGLFKFSQNNSVAVIADERFGFAMAGCSS
jgi:hypothetical protein